MRRLILIAALLAAPCAAQVANAETVPSTIGAQVMCAEIGKEFDKTLWRQYKDLALNHILWTGYSRSMDRCVAHVNRWWDGGNNREYLVDMINGETVAYIDDLREVDGLKCSSNVAVTLPQYACDRNLLRDLIKAAKK